MLLNEIAQLCDDIRSYTRLVMGEAYAEDVLEWFHFIDLDEPIKLAQDGLLQLQEALHCLQNKGISYKPGDLIKHLEYDLYINKSDRYLDANLEYIPHDLLDLLEANLWYTIQVFSVAANTNSPEIWYEHAMRNSYFDIDVKDFIHIIDRSEEKRCNRFFWYSSYLYKPLHYCYNGGPPCPLSSEIVHKLAELDHLLDTKYMIEENLRLKQQVHPIVRHSA